MGLKKMSPFLFATIILYSCYLSGVHSLAWMNISAPSVVIINENSLKPVYLNCQYELDEESSYLVLKWIKNNETIYHWIRGQVPSVYPKFREEIDESYKASSHPDMEYSGLALVKPSIETSGFYKCFVQTASDSKFSEKSLQVVDLKNGTIDLYYNKKQDETHLECVVDQVFPEPTMTITTTDDDPVPVITSSVNKMENGLYNATLIAVDQNGSEDTEYRCTATFGDLEVNFTTTTTSMGTRVLANIVFYLVLIFGKIIL